MPEHAVVQESDRCEDLDRRLRRLTEALAAFEKAIELGPESQMRDVFIRVGDEVAQELNR